MAAKPKPLKAAGAKLAVSNAASAPAAKKPRPAAIAITKLPVAKIAVLKPVANPAPQPAVSIASPKPSSPVTVLKKKDLIDKVVAVTGAKQALVRDIIEATLTVLGDALSKGAMLNLPPFGKAKVSRPSETGSGKAMTVKLRRATGGGQGGTKQGAAKAKQMLAEDED